MAIQPQQISSNQFPRITQQFVDAAPGSDLDIATLVQQDIERQRGLTKGPTEAEMLKSFQDTMSGVNGATMIGQYVVSDNPEIAKQNFSTLSDEEVGNLFGIFSKERSVPTQAEGMPVVAFSGPKYEEIRLSPALKKLPKHQQEAFIEIIQNRQNMAKIFARNEYGLPPETMDILMDSFVTGDFLTELARTMSNIPGDLARTPTLAGMAAAAMKASVESIKDDMPNGMETGYRERWLENWKQNMAGVGDFLTPYENMLNKSEFFDSSATDIQQWYKGKFFSQFASEEAAQAAWRATGHQRARRKIYSPGDEGFDPNMRNGEAYVGVERDAEGNAIFEDIGLPEQLVYEMIDLSYRELSGLEKMSIFAAETIPLSMTVVGLGVRKGVQVARKIDEFRKINYSPEIAKMTDYQVYKLIKGRDPKKLEWRDLWRNATLGIGQVTPGKLNMGRQGNRHFSTIQQLDDRIRQLKEFADPRIMTDLDEVASYGAAFRNQVEILRNPNVTSNQVNKANTALSNLYRTEREQLETRLRNYTLRGGGREGAFGYFSPWGNPYQRAVFADDMIISAAIGIGPQLIDGWSDNLDESTAEIFTALTAPLFAPLATRKTLGIVTSPELIRSMPYEVAKLFENAPLVGKFSKAFQSSRDTNKPIEEILAAENIVVTSETLEAFNTFRKMYQAMTPEWQARTDRAFQDYDQNMMGIRTSMESAVLPDGETAAFSPEEIDDMMKTLHLTVAEASGLAPMIAIQSKADYLKPGDFLNPQKMSSITTALEAEEDAYRRIGELAQNIQEKYTRTGGPDPRRNAQLQKFLEHFAAVSEQGKDSLSIKRQLLRDKLDQFVNAVETEIEPDTLDDIVNMKIMYTAPEMRDTINRADLIAETAVQIAEGARVQARELAGVAASMSQSQIANEVRTIADRLFDAEMGTKYSIGKFFYQQADNYAAQNKILIDLRDVGQKLHETASTLKTDPFAKAFGGGREYLSKIGGRATVAFENAAERGLRANYGVGVDEMMAQAGIDSYLDFALQLIKDDPSANVFKATISETEDVYRAFRDYEAANRLVPVKNKDVDDTFVNIVNKAYKAADPQMYRLTLQAREAWETNVGEQIDMGTLAGDARRGTIRRNVKSTSPEEGLHRYKKNKSPAEPFVTLSKRIVDYINEPDPTKRFDIKAQIEDSRRHIMYFLSGGDKVNGQYSINLDNMQRRVNADTASTILEVLVQKRLIANYESDIQAITKPFADTSRLTGEDKLIQREKAVQELARRNDYDFNRSARLREVEEMLSIPVTGSTNNDVIFYTPQPSLTQQTRAGQFSGTEVPGRNVPGGKFQKNQDYRALFQSDTITGLTRNIDELLEVDAGARAEYTAMAKELNNKDSKLRIAAQREEQAFTDTLASMGEYGKLAADPARFFDVVFDRMDADGFNALVQQFVRNGMDETEVRQSLAYMYQKGFFEKVGQSTSMRQGAEQIDVVLKEPEMLIEYVFSNSDKADVMKAVLGNEHFQDMKMLGEYARAALGDAGGFRSSPDIRRMTLDNMFSKAFNLARGMVGVPYLSAEIGGRMILLRRQSMLQLAMADRTAARLMGKILQGDEPITYKELNTLGLRMKLYIARGLADDTGEIPAIDMLFEDDFTKNQELLVEESEQREAVEFSDTVKELKELQIELKELSAKPVSSRTADDIARMREITSRIQEITR